MRPFIRVLLLAAMLALLILPGGVQAAPSGPVSPGAVLTVAPAGYYDGLIQYSNITNCFSIIQGAPYQERGAGAYVGYYADPSNSVPSPNTVYYVHVVVGGLGNSCSGMRAYLEIALPASTVLANDAVNQVLCFYNNAALPQAECPQNLPASSDNPGAYAIRSVDTAHANTWPIPQGGILEIRIPVRTSVALSNSQMHANVWMLDGNSSPWLLPSQGVYVFSNTNALVYPIPSATQITSSSAHTEVYLHSNGAGTIYFDLGTTPGVWSYTTAPFTISGAGGWTIFVNWAGLTPNTPYYWRARYVPNSGSTVIGGDQSMSTFPDGQFVIGQGAAADCTEVALNSVLPLAKEIQFNCGLQPVTITLTTAKSITTNLVIHGGGLVTLAFSGVGNHFNVQSGGNLTLDQITLSNGNNSSCGGAIHVLSGGALTLTKSSLLNNHSDSIGGAICNQGSVTINNSVVSSNSSLSHGGAIQSSGTLSITYSKFNGNMAAANGGALDLGGTALVSNTNFSANTAGLRGGGINVYYGSLTVTNSTLDANTSAVYGGGLSSDVSTTVVGASTFSNNTTSGMGGGVEIGGGGSLSLTNVTLSANHATTQGGGIYWGSGTLNLLNSTLAGNVSASQGGNIYVGSAANPNILVKNTLLAAGSPNNCDQTLTSQGYNLESANTCGLNAAGDKINQNPLIGNLAKSGSNPVATHPLLFASPAIDAGTNTGCPASDARGIARPQDGYHDGTLICDIGAYELSAQATFIFTPLVRR